MIVAHDNFDGVGGFAYGEYGAGRNGEGVAVDADEAGVRASSNLEGQDGVVGDYQRSHGQRVSGNGADDKVG